MNRETIRDALLVNPGRPSTLRMSDGTQIDVPHPDFLLFFGPEGPGDVGILRKPDGGFRIIALDEVTYVDTKPRTAAK
jgi:hypothetical protein